MESFLNRRFYLPQILVLCNENRLIENPRAKAPFRTANIIKLNFVERLKMIKSETRGLNQITQTVRLLRQVGHLHSKI